MDADFFRMKKDEDLTTFHFHDFNEDAQEKRRLLKSAQKDGHDGLFPNICIDSYYSQLLNRITRMSKHLVRVALPLRLAFFSLLSERKTSILNP